MSNSSLLSDERIILFSQTRFRSYWSLEKEGIKFLGRMKSRCALLFILLVLHANAIQSMASFVSQQESLVGICCDTSITHPWNLWWFWSSFWPILQTINPITQRLGLFILHQANFEIETKIPKKLWHHLSTEMMISHAVSCYTHDFITIVNRCIWRSTKK